MISKKILPLMGISILLLIVNFPQADADLCGDTVNVDVVEGLVAGGTSIFSTSGVVELSDGFEIAPDVFVVFTIFCDDDGDGISVVHWDYDNSNTFAVNIPDHSFWFTDLQWRDASGEVVDYQVDGVFHQTPSLMTTGFNEDTVHASVGAFQIAGLTSLFNDLQITAKHTAVGGEISPISTSALLLAGGQNMMSWMIPLVVAAAGFGIVISRKL